jgi:hypothetical protein
VGWIIIQSVNGQKKPIKIATNYSSDSYIKPVSHLAFFRTSTSRYQPADNLIFPDSGCTDSAIDIALYDPVLPGTPELPYRIVLWASASNPATITDITLCTELCDKDTTPHQTTAFTLLVDTPIDILLRIQEPPPSPPPLSHLRHLSNYTDWIGPPLRNEYSLQVTLQPGINHIIWCKGASTGMEASFSPPPYGNWPTISPSPINSQHDLRFLLHSPANRNYLPSKSKFPYPTSFATSLPAAKQPPVIGVYSVKGTVPSLQLAATLAVIGYGYLMPAPTTKMRIPHVLIDATYHLLRACWEDGTIAH